MLRYCTLLRLWKLIIVRLVLEVDHNSAQSVTFDPVAGDFRFFSGGRLCGGVCF